MVEYDPEADGNAESDLIYLKPTKYVIGGEEDLDGHSHIFYLRDDLPQATTDAVYKGEHHAHSIIEGPDKTLICDSAAGHTHTNLVVEEAGDYEVRTLFTG